MEGLGTSILDAMAFAKPVVSTTAGGIPEIVSDDINGLLVPPKDHESLAQAMERILTDKQLAERLAEGGYRSALANFSPQAVLQKYLRVLR